MPARHGRAALRSDRRQRARRAGRAASTRRSARTRRCSPISCAACWRTAPTPPSSIASPTPPFRSRRCSKTRSRRRARSFRSARRTRKSWLPRDLFAPERANSAGLDLSNEARLAALGQALDAKRGTGLARRRRGAPRRARSSIPPTRATSSAMSPTPIAADVDAAFARASRAGPAWSALAPSERARNPRRGGGAVRGRSADGSPG